MALTPTDITNNRDTLYRRILFYFNNPAGVSALLGNISVETSGTFDPRVVQGYNADTFDFCITYTNNVDSGVVSEYDFVHNGPNGSGYGLCQWTYYTRKQALYNLSKSKNLSIGSRELQIEHFLNELEGKQPSKNAIQTATDATIESSTATICNDFFAPGIPHLSERQTAARNVYNACKNLTPLGPSNENLTGALLLAQQICWDESHGYVMGADMDPDTDCSGLVGYCLSQNGFNVPRRWNTTTMIPTLTTYSGFTHYIYDDTFVLQHGDILVYDEGGGVHGHTFFYAENVTGYTDSNGDSDNISMLPRARIEASSSRDTPQTGDQKKNGTGAHWEVWVHAYTPPSSGHTWHVFRWQGGTPPTPPPPPPATRYKLPIWLIYKTTKGMN